MPDRKPAPHVAAAIRTARVLRIPDARGAYDYYVRGKQFDSLVSTPVSDDEWSDIKHRWEPYFDLPVDELEKAARGSSAVY